jgi:diguanylate cyclase (GGDEF)-like protein
VPGRRARDDAGHPTQAPCHRPQRLGAGRPTTGGWGEVSVRVRLTVAFLTVSLLIPLVGLLAVREQYAASQRAAQIEARHVAEPIAHTIANTGELTKGDREQLYHDQQRLQRYVDDLQRDLKRHMEVIDLHQRVLAAATPGKEQDEDKAAARQDTDAEVAATIRDGHPRTFVERDQEYPEGTLQVVIPLRSDQDRIVGAVVMEYTPIYRELLAAGTGTRRAIVAASAAGLLLGLPLGYGLARGLVKDLRRLGRAAAQLADGHDHVRAQVHGHGALRELATAFNDMAARIAAQKAALTEIAISDPLTGLHNRRSFQVRLTEEVERTRRSQVPFTLLLVDLDHFKQVNDQFGHQAGDQALQAVAAVLHNELRAVDLPARIGGEEFAVLLPHTAEQGALEAAERLRAAIAAQPIPYQGATLTITASVGVAWCPAHADTGDGLLRVADQALYQAKRAGRNRTRGPTELQPLPERT